MPLDLYCNEAITAHQDFSEQRNKKQDIQSLSTKSSDYKGYTLTLFYIGFYIKLFNINYLIGVIL
ncbi:hypothetical protein ACS79_15285 [Vibrio lentus]|nr:hypothetical protein ACS79_15285 [Vibrio lentus]